MKQQRCDTSVHFVQQFTVKTSLFYKQIPIITEEQVAVCDEKNGADQTMSHSNIYCTEDTSASGQGKGNAPHRAATPLQFHPSYLFIAAKVQPSHLQIQSYGTNLARINWPAFF